MAQSIYLQNYCYGCVWVRLFLYVQMPALIPVMKLETRDEYFKWRSTVRSRMSKRFANIRSKAALIRTLQKPSRKCVIQPNTLGNIALDLPFVSSGGKDMQTCACETSCSNNLYQLPRVILHQDCQQISILIR
jgi:hypothetical protein